MKKIILSAILLSMTLLLSAVYVIVNAPTIYNPDSIDYDNYFEDNDIIPPIGNFETIQQAIHFCKTLSYETHCNIEIYPDFDLNGNPLVTEFDNFFVIPSNKNWRIYGTIMPLKASFDANDNIDSEDVEEDIRAVKNDDFFIYINEEDEQSEINGKIVISNSNYFEIDNIFFDPSFVRIYASDSAEFYVQLANLTFQDRSDEIYTERRCAITSRGTNTLIFNCNFIEPLNREHKFQNTIHLEYQMNKSNRFFGISNCHFNESCVNIDDPDCFTIYAHNRNINDNELYYKALIKNNTFFNEGNTIRLDNVREVFMQNNELKNETLAEYPTGVQANSSGIGNPVTILDNYFENYGQAVVGNSNFGYFNSYNRIVNCLIGSNTTGVTVDDHNIFLYNSDLDCIGDIYGIKKYGSDAIIQNNDFILTNTSIDNNVIAIAPDGTFSNATIHNNIFYQIPYPVFKGDATVSGCDFLNNCIFNCNLTPQYWSENLPDCMIENIHDYNPNFKSLDIKDSNFANIGNSDFVALSENSPCIDAAVFALPLDANTATNWINDNITDCTMPDIGAVETNQDDFTSTKTLKAGWNWVSFPRLKRVDLDDNEIIIFDNIGTGKLLGSLWDNVSGADPIMLKHNNGSIAWNYY